MSRRLLESAAEIALDDQETRLGSIYVETAMYSPLRAQLLQKFNKFFNTNEHLTLAGYFEQVLTSPTLKVEL